MPDEPVALAKINITYHRDPGASEMMTLSDGASDAILYLSPLGGMNMLLELIDDLLQLLPDEGAHIYYWEGDQDYYRWRFQLDGDILHVEVTQLGDLIFSAPCPVWQFAAKVRLRASRLAVAEDEQRPNGGDWVRRDAAGALLAFLFQGARIGFVGELRESLLHRVDLGVLRLRARTLVFSGVFVVPVVL